MQKIINNIFFLFVTMTGLAQTPYSDSLVIVQLQQSVRQLQTELKNQKSDFSNQLTVANKQIEELQRQFQTNRDATNQTTQDLDLKITTFETNAKQKISEVDNSLGRTTLWTIIGILAAIIISGVLYLLLSQRQKSDKTDMIEQLSKTKTSIDESLVKEFDKQTELMNAIMEVLKQTNSSPNAEPDHSLALKVASEINIVERNIKLMDAGTKGLKQLTRSVEKLKDNLAANGYEMPQLLGKSFHQGLKVIVANSIPDENLEKDAEIITKILIPQVNYNGKMIQTAQIEVSVGY